MRSVRSLVIERAEALYDTLVHIRRDFCSHPELSEEETRTASIIAERLGALGLSVQTDVGGQGVVGVLQGARPGPVVAYRTDMDAMPIQDTLKAPYRSLVLGVKHACGHDVHMAIALGAAEALASVQQYLVGTVKFIFQPAEESLSGAKEMIAAGVLEAPRPEVMLALHAFPIPVGSIGISPGLGTAGMDEFRIKLYSPGGHLSDLVDRIKACLNALSTSVLPVGPATFAAVVRSMLNRQEHRSTILISCWSQSAAPSLDTHILGLLSVADPAMRPLVHAQIRQVLDLRTAEVGATYDLAYTFSNPPVYNNPELFSAFLPSFRSVVGVENVLEFRSPYPFAHEDFALYQRRIPGLFVWLGTANPAQGIMSLLHTSDFDVDEASLTIGVKLVVSAIVDYLFGKVSAVV